MQMCAVAKLRREKQEMSVQKQGQNTTCYIMFFMQKTMLKAAERNTSINHEKDFKDFNCSAPS